MTIIYDEKKFKDTLFTLYVNPTTDITATFMRIRKPRYLILFFKL
jgi:hypothetical protein